MYESEYEEGKTYTKTALKDDLGLSPFYLP